MSENIRSTNLHFNLDKDVQNRAWQYLQTMDKKKFKSYSQIIAISLVDYFDRYYKEQDDPYLETREREERFVEQIVTAVENAMNQTLPVYLVQTDRKLSLIQTENYPSDRQETVPVTERKLSGSNKERNNIKKEKQRSKDTRTAYGKYQNVFLSAEELEQLQIDVPLYREYIEKLSAYMQTSGKRYKDHAATVRSWYTQDHPAPVKRSYECKEDESL